MAFEGKKEYQLYVFSDTNNLTKSICYNPHHLALLSGKKSIYKVYLFLFIILT